MEIRRFGPGHRRPDAPPGTRGISGQAIWSDERANVSELAFTRRGAIGPQTNPHTTLFIVVSGGGHVQVGDEHVPVNHGEAVVWPADEVHAAWTDGSEMRAILVELPELGDVRVLDGRAREIASSADAIAVTPARGALAERHRSPDDRDETEGEPW
jgi:quercetin dioxygenase-like cupin family protein